MSYDELNDNGVRRLTVQVVCATIAVLATALRFYCKVKIKQGIHPDDWWLLATTVTYLGAVGVTLWGLFDGSMGKEVDEMIIEFKKAPSVEKYDRMKHHVDSLFIGFTIVLLAFFLAKVSILMLYRRIFATTQFKRFCLIMIIVSTMFFIAAQASNLALCLPGHTDWNKPRPKKQDGRCTNFNVFALTIGILETVLDIAILVMPVRAILGLQMPTRTKAVVSGIFLLGGFAIITNILRVYYQYQPDAIDVDFTQAEFWTNIHAATVILCACLPVYRPLQSLASTFLGKLRDSYRSSFKKLRGTGQSATKLTNESSFSQGGAVGIQPGYYPYPGTPAQGSAKELVPRVSVQAQY